MKLNRENQRKLIELKSTLKAQRNVEITDEDMIITDEDLNESIELI